MTRPFLLALLIPCTLFTCAAPADQVCTPFKGSSENQAVSAVPVDPDDVFVTTLGQGNATHLGAFTFISPHLSGLSDFSIDGTQDFTAANGDHLFATLHGNLHPVVDETGHVFLAGTVQAVITGGTGRFEGATGSFAFTLFFDTATAHSTATIDGTLCLPRGP
jgi:hypothetical protein